MVRDGWSVYDTDAEVDGRKLRLVAYRTPDDIEAGVEYNREQDLKGRKSGSGVSGRGPSTATSTPAGRSMTR